MQPDAQAMTRQVVLHGVPTTSPRILAFSMALDGGATLQIAGPVVLTLANGVTLNATVGNAAHPEWLVLQVASGGLTLGDNATLHGSVVAPNGTVTVGGNALLHGSVAADRLAISGSGLLDGSTR